MASALSGHELSEYMSICTHLSLLTCLSHSLMENTDSPSTINVTATRMKSWLTEGSRNTLHQKLPWTGSPHILLTESTHVGEQFTGALR